MNKKILTAAIGAALVAGPLAAQADLKISGRVAGSYTVNDGTNAFVDFGNGRLQFDAKDDSGWFARAARDLRTDKALANRDQYVGLKMDAGSFSFGRIAGAVKNLEGDPMIGTFLEMRNGMVKGSTTVGVSKGYGSSSFINNVVQFAGKFGDASVKIQYDPTTTNTASDKGHLGFGIKAKMAGANVFAGYNNQDGTAAAFWKVGGAMKFGDIKGKLYYENDGALVGDETTWVLGAEIGMGDGAMIDVSYSDKGATRTSAAYRLAYNKKVSKKARWWVGYAQNGSGTTGDTSTYGAGARVDF